MTFIALQWKLICFCVEHKTIGTVSRVDALVSTKNSLKSEIIFLFLAWFCVWELDITRILGSVGYLIFTSEEAPTRDESYLVCYYFWLTPCLLKQWHEASSSDMSRIIVVSVKSFEGLRISCYQWHDISSLDGLKICLRSLETVVLLPSTRHNQFSKLFAHEKCRKLPLLFLFRVITIFCLWDIL